VRSGSGICLINAFIDVIFFAYIKIKKAPNSIFLTLSNVQNLSCDGKGCSEQSFHVILVDLRMYRGALILLAVVF